MVATLHSGVPLPRRPLRCHGPSSGIPNGIFRVQPYDASRTVKHARIRRNLQASAQAGHAAVSLRTPGHIGQSSSPYYITSFKYLRHIQERVAPWKLADRRLSTSAFCQSHDYGRDGPEPLPVEFLPPHPRRDPAPHQRIQYLRLGTCFSAQKPRATGP